jgi:hypothetical protein
MNELNEILKKNFFFENFDYRIYKIISRDSVADLPGGGGVGAYTNMILGNI